MRRKIYMIAGEASGDNLASNIMQAVIKRYDGDVDFEGDIEFYGIGGAKMQSQGLRVLYPMQELTLIGVVEIIPNLIRLYRVLRTTIRDIKRLQPDIVISVDVSTFSLRVARALSREKFVKIHVVAPSVWAWKAWRAKQFVKFYDKILCLFPFEPPYFAKHEFRKNDGARNGDRARGGDRAVAEFIGHPLWDSRVATRAETLAFRAEHGIGKEDKLLLLLSGSRKKEVKTLMPIFMEAIRELRVHVRSLRVVILTLPYLREDILSYGEDAIVIDDSEQKEIVMGAADMALAASGTVSLELAKSRTPFVIGYRLNFINAFLARILMRVRFATLTNIIADRRINAEFINGACRAENLCEALKKLFNDDRLRTEQVEEAYRAVLTLELDKLRGSSSAYAADIIYNILEGKSDD